MPDAIFKQAEVVTFDGNSNNVIDIVREELTTPGPGSFSVDFWARPAAGGSGYRSPLTSRNFPPPCGYTFFLTPQGHWAFWLGVPEKDEWIKVQGSKTPQGQWARLTGTWCNSTGLARLYVNGSRVGVMPAAAYKPNTKRPLRIGGGATEEVPKFLFVGDVRDICIYDISLEVPLPVPNWDAPVVAAPTSDANREQSDPRFERVDPRRRNQLKLTKKQKQDAKDAEALESMGQAATLALEAKTKLNACERERLIALREERAWLHHLRDTRPEALRFSASAKAVLQQHVQGRLQLHESCDSFSASDLSGGRSSTWLEGRGGSSLSPILRHGSQSCNPLQLQRSKLPVFQKRQMILDAIAANSVVVIEGETGSGKTTQIPQFVLEEHDGSSINIICTQPRRISAMGVAQRVATEVGEPVGYRVGYHIRHERKASDTTQLLFCTQGILLRRLQHDPSLAGVTHIFLDEVHERSVESDFLLIILRDLLSVRLDLHIVLMSATLNAESFVQYFQQSVDEIPKVHIPGFAFPVEQFYLEHAMADTGCLDLGSGSSSKTTGRRSKGAKKGNKDNHDKDQSPEFKEVAEQKACWKTAFEKDGCDHEVVDVLLDWEPKHAAIPVELIIALINRIDTGCMGDGAVLVFLPGWEDIQKVMTGLESASGSQRWLVIPLHGMMAASRQRSIFEPAPANKRKIVLSTNIAESSITIDDVTFVIDSGKCNEKTYNAEHRIGCLLPAWISRASAQQRRGRAGRVKPGVCWHLFPKPMLEQLNEYQAPEMQRTPLEQVCLQVRALGLAGPGAGCIEAVLNKAMSPPSARAIANALSSLIRAGALAAADESMTPLGRQLVALPMDPFLGKAIIYAMLLGCLDPVLTVATILSDRSVFTAPQSQYEFASGAVSDHRAMVAAFDGWMTSGKSEAFCNENSLSVQTLRNVSTMRSQILTLLKDEGMLIQGNETAANRHRDKWPVVRVALTAGLYPQLMRVDDGSKFFTKDHGHVQVGRSSNATRVAWRHRWAIYFDKLKTTKGLFIHDISEVSPLGILLVCQDHSKANQNSHALLRFGSDGVHVMSEVEQSSLESELNLVTAQLSSGQLSGADRELVTDRKLELEQRLWGSKSGKELASLEDGEDPDAVRFVTEYLNCQGGACDAGHLLALLERQRPRVRNQMGSFEDFCRRHNDKFVFEKFEPTSGKGKGKGKGRGKVRGWLSIQTPASAKENVNDLNKVSVVGVDDWVCFEVEPADIQLINDLRLLLRRMLMVADPAAQLENNDFIDLLAVALMEEAGETVDWPEVAGAELAADQEQHHAHLEIEDLESAAAEVITVEGEASDEEAGNNNHFFPAAGDVVEAYWPDDDQWMPATVIEVRADEGIQIAWREDSSVSDVPCDYVRACPLQVRKRNLLAGDAAAFPSKRFRT